MFRIFSFAAFLLGIVATAIAAPPSNDAFANGQHLFGQSGTVAGTLAEATLEVGEAQFTPRSVWYQWLAPATSQVHWNVSGNGYSSTDIYTGISLDTLTRVASGPNSNYLNVTEGQILSIRISGSSVTGGFNLTWSMENDSLRHAFRIGESFLSPVVNTSQATLENDEVRYEPSVIDGIPVGKSVWFRWATAEARQVMVTTYGSNFDTVLALGTGNGSLSSHTHLMSNDDNPHGGTHSSIVFVAEPGKTYYFGVYGKDLGDGNITSGRAQVRIGAGPPVSVNFARNIYRVNEKSGILNVELIASHGLPSQIDGLVHLRPEGGEIISSTPFTITYFNYGYAEVPVPQDSVFTGTRTYQISLTIPNSSASVGDIAYGTVEVEDDDYFQPLAGKFSSMVVKLDGEGARIAFTMTATGRFTGKVRRAGASVAFSGQLSKQGEARVSVPVKGGFPVSFKITALPGGEGYTLISDDGYPGYFAPLAVRESWSKRNPVPGDQAGRYNARILPNFSELGPRGEGYCTVTLGKTGSVIAKGVLADGTPFSAAGPAQAGPGFSAYVPLYRDKGYLILSCYLTKEAAPGAIFESIHMRPASTSLSVPEQLREGFRTNVEFGFAQHIPPARDAFVSPGFATHSGKGRFIVNSENGIQETVIPFQFQKDGRAAPMSSQPGWSLKLTPSTGLYKGTWTPPGETKPRAFSGVILQTGRFFSLHPDLGLGCGFTLSPLNSKAVYLEPMP